MRQLVITLGLICALASAWAFSLSAAASGGTTCQHVDANSGVCTVTVHVDGTPGSDSSAAPANSTGNGSGCYWDPSKQGLTGPPAGPVACSTIDGYWSNAHNCYIQLAKPQPPPGDPVWQGHDPADGAIYNCSQPQTGMLVQLWSATAPSGGGPTPGEVAQELEWLMERAVDHMGPERGGRWMRKAYPWYVERMGGGKELQAAMQQAETIEQAREALYAAAR